VDTSFQQRKKPKYTRESLKLILMDESIADEKYGGTGDIIVLEGDLLRPPNESKTVLLFMHPSAMMNMLPLPVALARSGLHVCTACSRYPNNDATLIMEKCLVDLGAYVRHLKEDLGYRKVVLCGWSGGGSLSSFYQSEAEDPRIKDLPSGEPFDLSEVIHWDLVRVRVGVGVGVGERLRVARSLIDS